MHLWLDSLVSAVLVKGPINIVFLYCLHKLSRLTYIFIILLLIILSLIFNNLSASHCVVWKKNYWLKEIFLHQVSFCHHQVCSKHFFLTKTTVAFVFDVVAIFWKLFQKAIANMGILRLLYELFDKYWQITTTTKSKT